jgi:hypothetical protein
VDLPETPPASSHLARVREVVRCVTTGRRPLSNVLTARNGMEILMGAVESHVDPGLPLAGMRARAELGEGLPDGTCTSRLTDDA